MTDEDFIPFVLLVGVCYLIAYVFYKKIFKNDR